MGDLSTHCKLVMPFSVHPCERIMKLADLHGCKFILQNLVSRLSNREALDFITDTENDLSPLFTAAAVAWDNEDRRKADRSAFLVATKGILWALA